MNIIDGFLNRITMYRLVLYGLIVMLVAAFLFAFFGLLPFSPAHLLFSVLFLVLFCGFANDLFARVFEAPVNNESAYITALILSLIVTPAKSLGDFVFLGWLAVLAMGSKYMFALGRKHLFNPAAMAVVLTGIFLNRPADWWVGTLAMAPVVTTVGLLIVRKTRREDMVWAFMAASVTVVAFSSAAAGSPLLMALGRLAVSSSLLFFAFVMLTEPLTLPPTRGWQIAYGVLVGLLFAPATHIGSLYFTPELALVAGNLLAYIVSPKDKLVLQTGQAVRIAPDTYDFLFPLKKRLAFAPGQYMEWTLPHEKADDRGARRYFTIASSPTEDMLRLGIKFYGQPSSFKKALLEDKKRVLVGSQRAGDFVLPRDRKEKLVFIAGGIGVTPFRSMLKYLADRNEPRDIVFFYSNRRADEIVYREVFAEAQRKLGIRTVYTLTDAEGAPPGWEGERGRLSPEMIKQYVPDYRDRLFYLSGPHAMVSSFEKILKGMGVTRIKTDFFPGFA